MQEDDDEQDEREQDERALEWHMACGTVLRWKEN
jgi:hypothetical protein